MKTSPKDPAATSGAPQQTLAGLFERPQPTLEKTQVTATPGAEGASHTHRSDTQLTTHPEPLAAAANARTRESSAIGDLLAFHDEIRRALDRLASVVGNARNDVHDADTARHLVEFFEGPLLWHDEDEEVSLLRRLRARGLSSMHQSVVEATQRGHDKMESVIDDLLAELRAIARGAAAFDVASFEHNARALRQLLEGHLTLEETHLFPIVADVLTGAELDEVHQEMRARHGRPSADAVRSRRAVPL